MAEFTVNGADYRSGKLDAFKQFHTSRRLAKTNLIHMSDEDSEYVVKACLGVTQRKSGGTWAPMLAGDRMMFNDLKLFEMMEIVEHVLEDHKADFSAAPPALA